MNLMTIITKDNKSKKYDVTVDLSALERIASSLGLFQPNFLKDLGESMRDMKARRFMKARALKDLK